jgi:phenylalanyl-tRNA synthetase beta chain
LFFKLLGRKMDAVSLEAILPNAKAELDAWDDTSAADGNRTIKIELNDTNRPDLWSTAGLARQLRVRETGEIPSYPFFVPLGESPNAAYTVMVDESVRKVRPYLAGFVARGPAISDAMLKDFIQTQEKPPWNYGRSAAASHRAVQTFDHRLAGITGAPIPTRKPSCHCRNRP